MKVGVALSGGGARGFAHIGVLKVLVENGIPIDLIAGTSAGAIVGGAYAAGMSIDEILAMAAEIGWTNMTRPSLSPLGALSNAPMGAFLKRKFPITDFAELRVPFATVAYDVTDGCEIIYKGSGDMIFAIRASCAVPGVFVPPRNEEGHLIVDGGVTNVIPANIARDMGADVVIAVDLLGVGETPGANPRTAAGIIITSATAFLTRSALR
ncbi:MAG TPA: patatin-like phospholipase family protein, partial [Pyrinomonadaceae bacterium]